MITKHIDKDKVDNNGTAMAPYMMSVALFVGTLTANMMFDAFKPKKKPSSALGWWASKMSILGAVAIAQSSLVYIVVTSLLGLSPVSPLRVSAFLVLTSLTFMSFVTMLNVIFGKTGAFLSLIFLLLQLGGSGGTYPVVLSNNFFQSVSQFLPMTYAVEALRQTISIGGSIKIPFLVFISLLIVSSIILLAFYQHKLKTTNFSEFFNEELA